MSLQQQLAALPSVIDKLCAAGGAAGLSIGIIHEKQAIYEYHYGHRNTSRKQPLNKDTIFHVASLTKAFTAASIAILVDQGKLGWDDRLLDVISGFHQRNKDAESQATVIDLLAHRMGLAQRMNYWTQMEQELLMPYEETVNVIGALHKTADFRSTIKYNNWTFTLAGQLIERISKLTLEEFMQVHFFKPLGMTRTTLATPNADNYATSYITLTDDTPFEIPSSRIGNGTIIGGAAGLKTTVDDLLKAYTVILAALEDQKKTGLTATPGNPFRQAQMLFTPHSRKGATSYGLGLFLTDLPGEIGWISLNDGRVKENPVIARGVPQTAIAYHNGNMNGAMSSVHLIPQTNTAIVILSNTLASADLPDYIGGLLLETILNAPQRTDFLPLVLESREASIQGPLRTAAKLEADRKKGTSHRPITEYEGRYFNPERNFGLEVRRHGENILRMSLQDLPKTLYDLEHYHDDIWAWKCDRDDEAKRAMFPMLSEAFRKVEFLKKGDEEAQGHEMIDRLFWAYARDEPMGEIFTRVGS